MKVAVKFASGFFGGVFEKGGVLFAKSICKGFGFGEGGVVEFNRLVRRRGRIGSV